MFAQRFQGYFRVLSIFIDSTPLAMVSSYIGLFGAMGSLAVGHSFTAEFYPTVVRTKGIGITLTGAMGGAFMIPFWLIIDAKTGSAILTNSINGVLMLLAGLLSLTMPETLGQPMTETFEDFKKIYCQEAQTNDNEGEEVTKSIVINNSNSYSNLPETDI